MKHKDKKTGDVLGILISFAAILGMGLTISYMVTEYFKISAPITLTGVIFIFLMALFFAALVYGGIERCFTTKYKLNEFEENSPEYKEKESKVVSATMLCTWPASIILFITGLLLINNSFSNSITSYVFSFFADLHISWIIVLGIFAVLFVFYVCYKAVALSDDTHTKIISIIGTILIIAVIALFSYVCSPAKEEGIKDEFGNTESTAFIDATSEVEKMLKAPSTADFCESYEAEILQKGNTWTVEGWVDAQNSFGAMIRTDFVVKLTYTDRNVYYVEYCTTR